MPKCHNFMRNQCHAAKVSCNVDALPFQAQANYGTWSIDLGHLLDSNLIDTSRFENLFFIQL